MTAFGDFASTSVQQIFPGVLSRPVNGERITMTLVELDPGTHLPEHRHENEQVGMMLTGSMAFRIGDETREVRPGSTWCIPPNVPHDVVAGPEGAVVVEVFSPPRTDWDAIERQEPKTPRWLRDAIDG